MNLSYTKTQYKESLKNYRKQVTYITKKQPLYQLPDYDKRGKGQFHLDHMISIKFGFDNKIEPEVIGNVSNLRYIPYKSNISKRDYLTDESFDVIHYLIENGSL